MVRVGRCVPLCAGYVGRGLLYICMCLSCVVRCAACCAVIVAPGNPGQPCAEPGNPVPGRGTIVTLMLYILLIRGWGITLLINLGISL